MCISNLLIIDKEMTRCLLSEIIIVLNLIVNALVYVFESSLP